MAATTRRSEEMFRDPRHQKQLALSKKTFNRVSAALFSQLRKIFPADPKLQFLNEELNRMAGSQKTEHVPAMQFFDAMNTSTGLPSVIGSGEIAVIGELVLNRDERLFSDDCTADIPQLNAINFKAKWASLSGANRVYVWGYLQRMAELSAKVAASAAINPYDIAKLVDAASKASMAASSSDKKSSKGFKEDGKADHHSYSSSSSSSSPPESTEYLMEKVLQDPKVAAIVAEISEKVKKISEEGEGGGGITTAADDDDDDA